MRSDHEQAQTCEVGERALGPCQAPAVLDCGTSKHGSVDVYARWAPTYDATFGGLVARYRRYVTTLVEECDARNVLEVGVGTGLNLPYYPQGTRVTGVDMCPQMLSKAQRRVQAGVAATVELQLGDGERLGFQDGEFDFVVLLFVISVTPNANALLSEVARVLRPGGSVLIVNHFAGVRGFGWLERIAAPLADRIGFRSGLPIEAVCRDRRLALVCVRRLWPLGFFQLVRLMRLPVT